MVANCLAAVVPEWVSVLNLKSEDFVGLSLRSREVEAREDTGAASEGLTWLVERGLHNGVVLIGSKCGEHQMDSLELTLGK
jgi:hypothetical protein